MRRPLTKSHSGTRWFLPEHRCLDGPAAFLLGQAAPAKKA